MPSDRERSAKFSKEVKRQRSRKKELVKEAEREVDEILKTALERVRETLAGSPTEWDVFYLGQVEKNIKAVMTDVGDALSRNMATHIGQAWQAGEDLIDMPFAAAGVQITALLPELDTRQLSAIRSFMTGRLKDVATEAVVKINGELGLVIVGAQDPYQATKKIASHIGKGGKARAKTIVRTEVGRAYSISTQQRQDQAKEVFPGLKKQWRRSGKTHSRRSHDIADGQIADVDKPFIIGGVEMKHPRDPSAPASETINCGCDSLPVMEHWEVKQPNRQAFAVEETLLNNLKRDLNNQ